MELGLWMYRWPQLDGKEGTEKGRVILPSKSDSGKKNYLDHGLETAYDLADSGVEGRQGKMKMHNTIIKRKV